MRLNDIAVQSMLMNNAAKCFEPILVRKYGLEEIKVRGDSIFLKDGTLLCRVYGLSTAYNVKGAALFDAQKFKGVNIIVDEIAWEKNQRKGFSVCYNLRINIENICRSSRENVRIFMMMNQTEDSPEVLAMFGFVPLKFGVYKLKRKHCVIDYIPNTAAYNERRKKALANEIDTNTGNFTNKIERDLSLLYKGRLGRPINVIKFSKSSDDWFTLYENNVVGLYKNEKSPAIAMKRYIDETFLPELRDSIIEQNDVRAFQFRDILTQTLFYKALETIKK